MAYSAARSLSPRSLSPVPLSPVPLSPSLPVPSLPGSYLPGPSTRASDVDSPGALTPRLLTSIILCQDLNNLLATSFQAFQFLWGQELGVFLFGFLVWWYSSHSWIFNYIQMSPLSVEDCKFKHKIGNRVSLSNQSSYTGTRDTYHPLTWSSPWHLHRLPSVCYTSLHNLFKDVGQIGDRTLISHMNATPMESPPRFDEWVKSKTFFLFMQRNDSDCFLTGFCFIHG